MLTHDYNFFIVKGPVSTQPRTLPLKFFVYSMKTCTARRGCRHTLADLYKLNIHDNLSQVVASIHFKSKPKAMIAIAIAILLNKLTREIPLRMISTMPCHDL